MTTKAQSAGGKWLEKFMTKFMLGNLISFRGCAAPHENVEQGEFKGILKELKIYTVEKELKLSLLIVSVEDGNLIDILFYSDGIKLETLKVHPKNEALTYMLTNNISI